MASSVPASLKSADIARFVHRASQLEKVKPVVWYWCLYHVVHQILGKGLHSADAEALAYTTQIMDELEQFKAKNSRNDAVVDDLAGKAYIEQFSLETFSRADNTVRANKATRQTADTFQAAGTFLDLLAIWGPVEPEIAAKIKYAKYHAVRIAKAVKAGEDPNLSNPQPQPEPESELPELDPNDAEVLALEGHPIKPRQPSVVDVVDDSHRTQARMANTSLQDQSLHPSRDSSVVRHQYQPSVVEVVDEGDKFQNGLAHQSSLDESLHPSRAPSAPRSVGEAVSPLAPQDAVAFYTNSAQSDVSPMESPMTERKPSVGGNYFPVIPETQSSEQTHLPSVPTDFAANTASPPLSLPTAPAEASLPQAPSAFTSSTQPAMTAPMSPPTMHPNPEGHFIPPAAPGYQPQIPPNFIPQSQPRQPIPQAPPQLRQQPLNPPPIASPPLSTMSSSGYQQQFSPAPQPIAPPVQNVVVDEEAIMKAQKHARWAISALNFEDVPTAIRELEGALKTLGGR